tara:strand:+ start:1076 stop:1381 length:306 start_codon:yes stop_codon:yes gene_type:complete
LTEFQQLCYKTLKDKVPAGRVITYAGLAKLVNHTGAYRAVGSAMNKNPFAPEVPCHRVVKSDGHIGEFAFGKELKIKRLQEEGVKVINDKIIDFENKALTF